MATVAGVATVEAAVVGSDVARNECGVMGRLAWLVLAALLVCSAVARAAEPTPKRLPPVELFFGAELLGDVELSPSGRWLAVTVQPAGQRRGLAVYDLHGSEPPREVARFADMDIGQFDWVGNERLVFNLLDTHRGSGDQRLGSGLFSLKRDGSELRQLILMRWWWNPGQGTQASRRLDATHSLMRVPRQQVAGEEVVIVRGARNPNNPFGDWVLKRLHIGSGKVESLNVAEPADLTAVWFDTQGQPVAARSQRAGQLTTYERLTDAQGTLTREWKPLLRADSLDSPWSLHSIDSAGRYYVTQPVGPKGEAVLKRLDRATGQPTEAALVAVPGYDFTGQLIDDPRPGHDPLLGVRVLTDSWTTVWFHPELAALQKAVDARLPGRANVLHCARCRDTDRTVVVVSESDRQPREIWLWRGTADAPATWRRIGSSRPAVDPREMAEKDFTRYAARDGLEIPLWVTLPAPGSPAGPAPAVMLVHGGPWVRGSAWGWNPMSQFLASRGYVVLEPEFRGSTGFGRQHFRAGWRQWGQAMQNDLVDAVRWATAQGLVDPKRVCIAGGSYGGYATLMGLVNDPDVFRCGAAWVPVADLHWLLREGPPDAWDDESFALSLPRLVADREAETELIRRISPLEQVQRIRAPLLLAWGEEDERAPPAQTKALRDALVKAGRPPQAVGYEGEGHSWLKVATRVDFARRLEAFLQASLAAEPPAPR